jgi:hypothetical protein
VIYLWFLYTDDHICIPYNLIGVGQAITSSDERDIVVMNTFDDPRHHAGEPIFPEHHREVFLSFAPKKTFGKNSVEVGSKKVR